MLLFKPFRSASRTVLVAIVVAALGLFTLRPFCDLVFAPEHAAAVFAASGATHVGGHTDDTPSAPCCASVKDGPLLSSWDPAAIGFGVELPDFASGANHAAASITQPRIPSKLRFGGPPPRSYYARSARILR